MPYPKVLTRRDHRAVWLIMVLCLGLLFLTAWLARSGGLVWGERTVFEFIYGLPAFLTPVFLIITLLGSSRAVIAVVAIALLRKSYSAAMRLALAGGLTAGTVWLAKHLIERPRPTGLIEDLLHREVFVTGFGFPSGHTAVATALSITLLLYLPRRQRWIVPVWIAGVAISRIYLGVHAPLDIVGGIAIGTLVATVIIITLSTPVKRSSRRLAKRRTKA